jgi:choline dehydrogenase-like flavoprotein
MYCWLDWFLGNLPMFDYIIIGGGSAGCVLAADWRYADVLPYFKKAENNEWRAPSSQVRPVTPRVQQGVPRAQVQGVETQETSI